MKNDITLNDIIEKTTDVVSLFSNFEKRKWNIEAMMIELMAEVGTLADTIMMQQKYRSYRADENDIDLEDDICDIFFVLIMISTYFEINLGEAYLKMINNTKDKLKLKLSKMTREQK